MPQNVIIKRYGGSSVGWEDIYPKTTWSQIENKPSSFTPASHEHDSTYLKKSGGTMTGALNVNAPFFAYNYTNSNNAPAIIFDKPGSNYTGIGANGTSDTIQFGAATYSDGIASWVNSYKQKWNFNGKILEDGVFLHNKYQQSYTGFDVNDSNKVGYTETYDNRSFQKISSSNGWDATAHSIYGYKICKVSFTVGQNNKYLVVGLDANPTNEISYETLDYCWYPTADGYCYIYEGGTSQGNFGNYNSGDTFSIEYSNSYVRYYHNGTLMKTTYKLLGDLLYFGTSFYQYGAVINNVVFEPLYDSYLSTTKGGIINGNVTIQYGNLILGQDGQGCNITLGTGAANGYFRYSNRSSTEAGFYYSSLGDESVVFANQYSNAGWMFVSGAKPSDLSGWDYFQSPALHIKKGCVGVNKKITDYTLAFQVNGRSEIYASADTPLNLASGSTSGCFVEFKTTNSNNSNVSTAGYLGISSTHLPLIDATNAGGGLKVLMTNADFSVSGTTLTITIPSTPS